MSSNDVLEELNSKADVDRAKRELVLRFVKDQESLQTSQVELKLVDNETIDLIDSAFNGGDDSSEEKHQDKSQSDLGSGVAGIHLDDTGQQVVALAPRPPSGRSLSRRRQRNSTHDNKKEKGAQIHDGRLRSPSEMDRTLPSSSLTGGPAGALSSDISNLNSSWPQNQFVSRKINSVASRKYVLCSPENKVKIESSENAYDGTRPASTQSIAGRISAREVLAARVRKHSASNRVSCNLEQITMDSSSRSSSPVKTFSASRQGRRSRGRAYINLNLEPVHASELPLLRGASAPSTGPYALVQLPPITPATIPPST